MGGYGFCIHLSTQFRDAVKASKLTQENVDRVLDTYRAEWLQKCGLGGYFDPENCGYDAKRPAIPSERTRHSFGGTGLRVSWGDWGPEHITVPGNACGLDIDRACGSPFENGKSLLPHNVDSWGQVCALLITFTWFAHYIAMEVRLDESRTG